MYKMKNLKKQIKIKNKYAQMILDLAIGYDGYTKEKELKRLIDEISELALLLIQCDDKKIIYISGNKGYNILFEEQ